jgi:hypothetical protein
MEALIRSIQSIPAVRVYQERLSESEKRDIEKAYNLLGHKFVKARCNDCYEKAYIYIKNITNENLFKMTNKTFKLITGKKIMMHGLSDVITSANLTDEKALMILKKNSNAIKLFETYPVNWKELADNYDANKARREKPEIAEKKTAPKKVEIKVEDKTPNDASAEKKKVFSKKDLKDLQLIATSLELNEDEWGDLKKADLIDYIIEKTK